MEELRKSNSTERAKLIRQLEVMLSGELVDVEMNKQSYEVALDLALDYYRMRSENSVEESFVFFQVEPDRNDYQFPNETINVRKLYRRAFGAISAGSESASMFDPFDVAFTNMYLIQDTSFGGMASYDFYNQNLELAGRLFGQEYNFVFNTATKRLKLGRRVRAKEEVIAWVYNYKPDEVLLQDTYAKPWIRSCALAECKLILGGAYEKYSSLAGPQGGITLNGAQLKAEGAQEKQLLEEQIKKYAEGGAPLGFIMG